ncbi:MAG: hypothetical protein HFI97_03585 [Lachnospiraceae bacterium]|jgi:hypothetical protein|nr:hypothetical protein [Lachnospiraceae bacterium]MCI9202778.1 hypothetical protein [Lachnospiraceae bacterium]
MLPEIRKCADKYDIRGLRYIFIDALDVDPTFEKYRDGYEYCKKIDGLFEVHQELSGLNQNEAGWNIEYWDQLKIDMRKNFSEKRYVHMMQVAKVVYAEKIKRLVKERGEALSDAAVKTEKEVQSEKVEPIQDKARVDVTFREDSKTVSGNEMEERRLAEEKRALDEENRRIEAQQRAQRERIEASKRAENDRIRKKTEDNNPKKGLGIVLAIAVIAAVAMIIVLMLR